jgi:hypothetical protein
MADIINLRRARKHKARTEKDVAAQANRFLHGTPKALRETAKARKDQATDRLDGKKLDTPSE